MFKLHVSPEWKVVFEQNKETLRKIEEFILQEQKTYGNEQRIFPAPSHVFNAVRVCPFHKVRVGIIGQDCYHGVGQANGLCFSVPEGMKVPPSLRNIMKEMQSCIGTKPRSTDFTYLAEQGVLLLNGALTVRERMPMSHAKIWKPFTDEVIRYISKESEKPVAFVLWGNFAKKKASLIDRDRHFLLTATHPSPLSANRGGFFGCAHFSKINDWLKKRGEAEINW